MIQVNQEIHSVFNRQEAIDMLRFLNKNTTHSLGVLTAGNEFVIYHKARVLKQDLPEIQRLITLASRYEASGQFHLNRS